MYLSIYIERERSVAVLGVLFYGTPVRALVQVATSAVIVCDGVVGRGAYSPAAWQPPARAGDGDEPAFRGRRAGGALLPRLEGGR